MSRPAKCKECGTVFMRGAMGECPNCGAKLAKSHNRRKERVVVEAVPPAQHTREWRTNNIYYLATIKFAPVVKGFPRGLYTTAFDPGTRIQKLYCGNPACQKFLTTNMVSKGSANLHCKHCGADNLFAFQG
jgi:uncharacterized OB-fold protein